MSKIKNDWPTENKMAQFYRRMLSNAAHKSALNAAEFEKRGIPYEDVYRTTSRQMAKQTAAGFLSKMEDKQDIRQLGAQMTVELGKEAFGMEIKEMSKDCFAMDMHYCPHLKGWQDMGMSDEMCAKLCDLAMEGDYAMAKEMGFDFENSMRLANGDPVCRVVYRVRKENAAEEKKD